MPRISTPSHQSSLEIGSGGCAKTRCSPPEGVTILECGPSGPSPVTCATPSTPSRRSASTTQRLVFFSGIAGKASGQSLHHDLIVISLVVARSQDALPFPHPRVQFAEVLQETVTITLAVGLPITSLFCLRGITSTKRGHASIASPQGVRQFVGAAISVALLMAG